MNNIIGDLPEILADFYPFVSMSLKRYNNKRNYWRDFKRFANLVLHGNWRPHAKFVNPSRRFQESLRDALLKKHFLNT